MTRLIDDLMDVSRVRHGKIELQKERTDLTKSLTRSIDSTKPLLTERRHELEVQVPSEPLWVDVDGLRIEQVVGELANERSQVYRRGGSHQAQCSA